MSIIEERCYVLNPAFSTEQYYAIYRIEGLDIQRGCLGDLIVHMTTEVGQLNAIVSLWRYPSFEQRQVRRAQLAAMPEWQAFLGKVRPMIQTMSNRLLLPADFSPLQ